MVAVRKSNILISATAAAGAVLLLTWLLAKGSLVDRQAATAALMGMLVCAMALGVLHHLDVLHRRAQLDRVVQRVKALDRGSGAAPQGVDAELAGLWSALQQCVGGYQRRLDQQEREARELRVHLRLADTERQQAERILHAINDAVIVTDASDELVLANQAAQRLLDLAGEPDLQRPIDQVLRDPVLVKMIQDTREAGDTTIRHHVEHKRSENGREHYYQVSLALLEGEQAGETAGVVAILRDVTRDRELSELKSDFVSSVSHELRTPLSSIKAYMEMLLDGEARDEQTRTEFYNVVQGETNRLSRLIDNILSINRIESGAVNVHRTQVAINSLLQETVDLMQPQARAKDLELVLEPATEYLHVFADRDMLQQAVLNLVSNAVKYTLAGGKVGLRVSADRRRRTVSVSVADSGVGIPPQDLPRVFEKFYRVNDHKKLAKGTGLGLNLVQQIVETVHGGSIAVQSQVDQGSVFTITLPLPESEPLPAPGAAETVA